MCKETIIFSPLFFKGLHQIYTSRVKRKALVYRNSTARGISNHNHRVRVSQFGESIPKKAPGR